MTEDNPNIQTFDRLSDYATALAQVCGLAQHTLCVFDKNFDSLGFNSLAYHDQLRAFLLSNPANRLYLLVQDASYVLQHCPRILSLLQHFGSQMSLYQLPQTLRHIATPFAVADGTHCVRRFHFDQPQGVLERQDNANGRHYQSYFMDLWSASKKVGHASEFRL